MATKMTPLHDRILVKRVDEQESVRGGIIIPDSAKEKPQEGEVIALGTGKRDDDGKLLPFTVKKGDKTTAMGRIVVAADGKSRTVTAKGTDEHGKPFKTTSAYDKQ